MRDQASTAPPLSEQEIQIRQRAAAFVCIGMPTLIYFGIIAAIERDWTLSGLVCATAIVIAFSFAALRRGISGYLAVRPAVVAQTILLLPPREGGIWAAGSTAIAVYLMSSAADIQGGTAYTSAYIIRFTIVTVLTAGVLLWSETLLQRYRERIEGQNAALAAERDQLEHEIEQRTALEEELRYLATTDPLTGLHNRRAFMPELADEMTRSQRLHSRFTLLILDLDHFKQVNDTYGHPAGDAVLAHLAALLTEQFRSIDKLARIGGEEFAILLVDTKAEGAANVIERLLNAIRQQPTVLPERGKTS